MDMELDTDVDISVAILAQVSRFSPAFRRKEFCMKADLKICFAERWLGKKTPRWTDFFFRGSLTNCLGERWLEKKKKLSLERSKI